MVSLICTHISLKPIPALAISALTAVLVPNMIFFICFFRKKQFTESLAFVDSLTRGKMKLNLLAGAIEKRKNKVKPIQ